MVPASFIAAEHDGDFDTDDSLTALTPDRVLPGDVLIAVIACGDSLSVATMPDGWASLVTLSSTTRRAHVMRRVVESDEPASHTFVLSGAPAASEPMLELLHYRGVHPTAAVVASGIAAVAASTSYPAPSVAAAVYSDVLILIHYADDDITFTADATTTERTDVASGASGAIMIADHHKESTGATGVKTATGSGSANGFAAAVLLSADALLVPDTLTLDPPGALGLPSVGV